MPNTENSKILITTDYFWPRNVGGVENVTYLLAKEMAERGFDVAVFTFNPGRENIIANDSEQNFRIFRAKAYDLTNILGIQIRLPRNPFTLRKVIRSWNPNLIHSHSRFFSSTILTYLFKRDIPNILTVHVSPFKTGLIPKLIDKLLLKIMLKPPNVITKVFREHIPNNSQAIYIHNGVENEKFRPICKKTNTFKVVSVGRLITNKNPKILLESIPKTNENIHFVFVGDGPLRKTLVKLSVKLGISSRVEFLGARDDVSKILQQCDLMVRTSDTDGMSLSVLEALSTGLPVVASEAAGSGIIENNFNGFILKDVRQNEIAKSINELYMNKNLYKSLSVGARETALKYRWSSAMDMYEDIYKTLISDNQ